MRHIAFTIAASTLGLALMLGTANAQDRDRRDPDRYGPVPAPGAIAIGGFVGASLPGDPSFQTGLNLGGSAEAFLTRHVSIRGQVSGSWWDIQNRGFTGTVKPLVVEANAVYNFRGRTVHPYVTAGIGLYDYRSHEGNLEGSDNEVGLNLGAGLEYFVHRHTALTGEVAFHDATGPFTTPVAAFNTSNFWTLTVGVKAFLR
jgi:hypothetical protein